MTRPTVLVVPGLRDHVERHWQTLLAAGRPHYRVVPALGRDHIDCAARVAVLDREAASIDGPIVIVAHSAGTLTVAHWARKHRREVCGALLATPPDFETPMPAGYPSMEALADAGWLPVPREPLPFPSIVAASHDDPLARIERVAELARAWGSRFVDLGTVGHLNPASGYGPWPRAEEFIAEISATATAAAGS